MGIVKAFLRLTTNLETLKKNMGKFDFLKIHTHTHTHTQTKHFCKEKKKKTINKNE